MSLTKQDILTFLNARPFCVIATANNESQPEAAFVAYSSNQNLEVIIGTSSASRKHKNLMENRAAALVVGDTTGEVQYEGDVEIITGQQYETLMAEGRFNKLSGFDKYREDPMQVYLLLHPTWIRFITHGDPDQVEEFTEFA